MTDLDTVSEEEREEIIRREQERDTGWRFFRTEERRTVKTRVCDCHHTISRGEEYLYSVGKLKSETRLWQSIVCGVCARHGRPEWGVHH